MKYIKEYKDIDWDDWDIEEEDIDPTIIVKQKSKNIKLGPIKKLLYKINKKGRRYYRKFILSQPQSTVYNNFIYKFNTHNIIVTGQMGQYIINYFDLSNYHMFKNTEFKIYFNNMETLLGFLQELGFDISNIERTGIFRGVTNENNQVNWDDFDDEEIDPYIPDDFKGHEDFYNLLLNHMVFDKFTNDFELNKRYNGYSSLKSYFNETHPKYYINNAFYWNYKDSIWYDINQQWFKILGIR